MSLGLKRRTFRDTALTNRHPDEYHFFQLRAHCIGVGRFRILGGARFRILGGIGGGGGGGGGKFP